MKTLFSFLQKSTPEVPSASVIRCAAGTVLQPVQGHVIPREAIPDQTLASGVLTVLASNLRTIWWLLPLTARSPR